MSSILGRVVATERRPNTPHEFHFWTALDSPVGIGTIVRVDGAQPIDGQIPHIYGIVVEGFSYTDLQSPMHDVLGLRGHAFQSLYHFTVGRPVDDTRLTTEPGYPWEAPGEPSTSTWPATSPRH